MGHEVLALKYRPRRFREVVGQDAVVRTLQNAIRSGRLPNAWLLCGSRGTGKTTVARILAKALNCPAATDAEPCAECPTCRAIAEGQDVDVLEIDGASNRGIDEIRSIRDNAAYVPSRSKFKIYILDEVHMLTIQAFNALLKTLEEPPPHVRFIFATTEPHALPDTILSRCQRHEFRRLAPEIIEERLREICRLEGLDVDDDVVTAIAARSEGGMRDSISLLDQVLSFSGPRTTRADLDQALGTLERRSLDAVIEAATSGDTKALLAALDPLYESGRDPEQILDQVLGRMREILLALASGAPVPEAGRGLVLDRVIYAVRLLLNARRDMGRLGHDRTVLEVTLLRFARSGAFVPVESVMAALRSEPSRPGGGESARRPAVQAAPATRPLAGTAPPAARPAPRPAAPGASAGAAPAPGEGAPADAGRVWDRVIERVGETRRLLAAAARQARATKLTESELVVTVGPESASRADALRSEDARDVLGRAASEVLGRPVTVRIVVGPGASAAAAPRVPAVDPWTHPEVKPILDTFEGTIVNVENDT